MKDLPCSWIGRINIVRITILSKSVYRFNEIPTKILMLFFKELEKSSHEIHLEAQKAPDSQAILSKRVMLQVSQYLTSNYTIEPKLYY
jgi:hypothetical protein